jgi:peptide/nickel transport system ATP-binding protein
MRQRAMIADEPATALDVTTQALLRRIPQIGPMLRLEVIMDTAPDPYNRPKGCPFSPCRLQRVVRICDRLLHPRVVLKPRHEVRCVLL